MNTKIKIKVTEIQRFCMHDGPGVRTTVFLKGCPLRCEWCHNPETKKKETQLLFYSNKCIKCGNCVAVCPNSVHAINDHHTIDRSKCNSCFSCEKSCPTRALESCGKELSVEEILSIVEKDRSFYCDNGGITLSGGEPLAQKEATLELLKAAKQKGLNTAVETCGYVDAEFLLKTIPFVDLFLWDLKDTNATRHKKYTGVDNKKILDNLALANSSGANIRLRCILINGINTDEQHYNNVAKIASSLSNCQGVEFIPYHAYGGAKQTFIGGRDNGRVEWIPTIEQIEKAKTTLTNIGISILE